MTAERRESRLLQIGVSRLPILVGVGASIVTLLLWYALHTQEYERIEQTISAVAETVEREISTRMDTRIFALVWMAQRWAHAGAPPQAQWEFEAELNFHQFPGYQAILWVDPMRQARWLVARDANQTLQSFYGAFTQYAEQAFAAIRNQETVAVTPVIDLGSGGKGFMVCVPIMHEQQFEGFIVGVFVFQDLLDAILKNMAIGYAIELFDGVEEVYRRDSSEGQAKTRWAREATVDAYGVSWRVRVWPLREELAIRRSALPEVTLNVGFGVAVLLAWTVALARTARARAYDLERTNQELNQEVKVRQHLSEELEKARAELELRVQERTAELARANEELQRENLERQRAEAARARQAQELARSNSELEQFAYVASHDLQEPLRKILAFGDRLKRKHDQDLSVQGRDYLERMQEAAARMQTLIIDLLTLSRVTIRSQPFVWVDLSAVAQTVVSDMEVRIQQVQGHVHVDRLPTIEADPLQMSQLLQNLIGNALKFHREGEPPIVKVWSTLLQMEENTLRNNGLNQQLCQICVEDNGIGFDEKYLDRIFEPFQRLHGRGTYEGTGMGLAICRKIVERHEGNITARSAPGQGTTFIVTLPTQPPDMEMKPWRNGEDPSRF
jgi:signal transduction histidine kinase